MEKHTSRKAIQAISNRRPKHATVKKVKPDEVKPGHYVHELHAKFTGPVVYYAGMYW